MFLGWDQHTSSALRERQARGFMRKRTLQLRLDKPILQNRLPRCLSIDEWTNKLLLSIATDRLELLNLDTEVAREKPLSYQTVDCVWYPFDSGLFVTCNLENVFLWDTASLNSVRMFPIGNRCNQLAFSRVPTNPGVVAVGAGHGEVRLISLLSGSAAHTINTGVDADILCVAWSPREANVLVTAGADSRILLWDVRKTNGYLSSLDELNQDYVNPSQRHLNQPRLVHHVPSRLASAHSRAAVTSLTFLEDGRLLLSTGSDGSARLWRESPVLNQFYNTQVSFAKKLAGRWGSLGYRACISDFAGVLVNPPASRDHLIDCVDIASGEVKASLNAHVRKVRCLAFRQEHDPELYSAGDDGFVLKWSCKTEADEEAEADEEDDWSF